MREEASILIGKQSLEVTRIDIIAGGGKPPASFAREIGPEQGAVAVENNARDFEIAPERRRPIGLDQAGQRACQPRR